MQGMRPERGCRSPCFGTQNGQNAEEGSAKTRTAARAYSVRQVALATRSFHGRVASIGIHPTRSTSVTLVCGCILLQCAFLARSAYMKVAALIEHILSSFLGWNAKQICFLRAIAQCTLPLTCLLFPAGMAISDSLLGDRTCSGTHQRYPSTHGVPSVDIALIRVDSRTLPSSGWRS